MATPAKHTPGQQVVAADFLGIKARAAWVEEGGVGIPHIFKDDFVIAVQRRSTGNEFDDRLISEINRLARPVRVEIDGRTVYAQCLSEANALEIGMQMRGEVGRQVRSMMLEAFYQLRRLYSAPVEAAEHFAEKAVESGIDAGWVAARVEGKVFEAEANSELRRAMEAAGRYDNKAFRGKVFAIKNCKVCEAATGKTPKQIKALASVKAAPDAMNELELRLRNTGNVAVRMLAEKHHPQLVTNMKAGPGAGLVATEKLVEYACRPIAQVREQYRAMGL